MEIKLVKVDDVVEVECNSGPAENERMNYETIVAMLMAGLDGATRTILSENTDEKLESYLYDRLDGIFGSFLERMFPSVDPDEFTLTDAAIVKAQDEIINEAFVREITLEEALEEYENKAREYVAQRRGN